MRNAALFGILGVGGACVCPSLPQGAMERSLKDAPPPALPRGKRLLRCVSELLGPSGTSRLRSPMTPAAPPRSDVCCPPVGVGPQLGAATTASPGKQNGGTSAATLEAKVRTETDESHILSFSNQQL